VAGFDLRGTLLTGAGHAGHEMTRVGKVRFAVD